MAASQSILVALSALCDDLVEAECLAKSLSDIGGDHADTASLPFVFSRQVSRIRASSDALETLIRQRAIPVLQDMESTLVRRAA